MNFIIPIGDFVRKGGDVMLGDLVLEDARLQVIRDQSSALDPNIINRAQTNLGNGLSIEFQNELGVGVSVIGSYLAGNMYISPNDNREVFIPGIDYGVNVKLWHTISGEYSSAPSWWLIYSLMSS